MKRLVEAKKLSGPAWHHEVMSKRMLDKLVSDNNIDIEPEDVKMIQDIIDSTKEYQQQQKRYENKSISFFWLISIPFLFFLHGTESSSIIISF